LIVNFAFYSSFSLISASSISLLSILASVIYFLMFTIYKLTLSIFYGFVDLYLPKRSLNKVNLSNASSSFRTCGDFSFSYVPSDSITSTDFDFIGRTRFFNSIFGPVFVFKDPILS